MDFITKSTSFGDTNDYDLVNLLYLQSVPSVAPQYQDTLQRNVKSINMWQAWELNKVEVMTQQKLKPGILGSSELPRDNSLASKYRRMEYRGKVVDAYRHETPWLSTSGVSTNSVQVTADEDNIALTVVHGILGLESIPQSPQVFNAFKALRYSAIGSLGLVQPFLISVVDHQVDQSLQACVATVLTFNITVTLNEVKAPGNAKAAPGPQKNYQAIIKYTVNTAKFNFDSWNQSMSNNPADYAVGKQSLLQRQLTLLETEFLY